MDADQQAATVRFTVGETVVIVDGDARRELDPLAVASVGSRCHEEDRFVPVDRAVSTMPFRLGG